MVVRVGELLSPITAAMGRGLLEGEHIQADETPVECAEARWQRKKAPSLPLAIHPASWTCGFRLENGS
jgi:hypothetical protein